MTLETDVYVIDGDDPYGPPVQRPLTAAGGPMEPPDEWFENPELSGPTPLTITADGRVYGHIAPWNVRHIGLPGNRTAPHSKSNYAYFKTGVVRTASGKDQPVGQLTLAGGHAPITADARLAVQHYDDTKSAICDLNVGEDRHGIWVAGATRPEATDSQIRALRASAPSGDWRPINGGLELVAVCQVNTPGFPIPRALCASGTGEVLALVAAGAREMFELRLESMPGLLADRVAELEAMVASIQKDQLRSRVRARS